MTNKKLLDGIYFDLDEDVYHRLDRLSNSAEKQLLISPADYWFKSAMNPNNDIDVDVDVDVPDWAVIGRAYHCARLEPELFEDKFAFDKSATDFPDALTNATQVGAELKLLGAPIKKAGEKVGDQWQRLLSLGYQGQHLATELEAHRGAVVAAGKTLVPAAIRDDLLEDMRRINDNPEVADKLRGGCSEVSILWTDEETGLAMKCRVDHLKVDLFTDFKTFSNPQQKEVKQSIRDQICYKQYYMQAWTYFLGTEQIRSKTLEIIGEATEKQRALIDEIQSNPFPLACWFVFQEKGGKPNLFAFEFMMIAERPDHIANKINGETPDQKFTHDPTAISMKAKMESRHAKGIYMKSMEIYGREAPWYPLDMIGTIGDDDFSPYFLDRKPEGY